MRGKNYLSLERNIPKHRMSPIAWFMNTPLKHCRIGEEDQKRRPSTDLWDLNPLDGMKAKACENEEYCSADSEGGYGC